MKLSDIDPKTLSPMMRQYECIKKQYPNHIIMFRLGDFYEMFFDDALQVSQILDLTLTGRDCGLSERAPMCGVPYHSYEIYAKKLLDAGLSCAICEQLTVPNGNEIVKRGVVRVITPGTLIEDNLLKDGSNNYICSIFVKLDGGDTTGEKSVKPKKTPNNAKTAMCFCDVSTGEISVCVKHGADMQTNVTDELARYSPSEVIMNADVLTLKAVTDFIKLKLRCACAMRDDLCFNIDEQAEIVAQHLGDFAIEYERLGNDLRKAALCGMFQYLFETQKRAVSRFIEIEIIDGENYMAMDDNAMRNLELTETLRNKEKKGSLLWHLDDTETSAGKRMLKQWLAKPLLSPAAIMARNDAVETLLQNSVTRAELRGLLSETADIERLMTRIVYKTASPRDLKALSDTIARFPLIKNELASLKGEYNFLEKLSAGIADLTELLMAAKNALTEDPPAKHTEGGVIKDGYSAELDRLRGIIANGSALMEKIERRERERTGIKNLKINYNRVFGYYIEVTRSYYALIPKDYIRKQTLANAERFVTDELKQAENDILTAKDKSLALESELFINLRDYAAEFLVPLQKTAKTVATIDVLSSLAETAAANDYVKPEIAIDGIIHITNGRHPVVEKLLDGAVFVPNDTYLDCNNTRMAIVTGPNMSGKSTYMRQTAIIALMAQMGGYVPASRAKITPVDKIFTRIGASDDLTAGQSTFMVEMSEVADILNYATKNSFVIVDEIGRGTATSDGLSIARAVAEHIANPKKLGCKCLFATHYHELSSLEKELAGVKNLSVSVKKVGDDIRFLHKIVNGETNESYGIEVAKLAGLPNSAVKRAKELLSQRAIIQNVKMPQAQVTVEDLNEREALQKLRKINIDELNNKECRQVLEDLLSLLNL